MNEFSLIVSRTIRLDELFIRSVNPQKTKTPCCKIVRGGLFCLGKMLGGKAKQARKPKPQAHPSFLKTPHNGLLF
jgi:hypothetical protein